jgi:hypothetical protein
MTGAQALHSCQVPQILLVISFVRQKVRVRPTPTAFGAKSAAHELISPAYFAEEVRSMASGA